MEVDLEICKKELYDVFGIVIWLCFLMNEFILKYVLLLRFIVWSGVGMENIDMDYCVFCNIDLFNLLEGNWNVVGEYVFGMLFDLMNWIMLFNNEVYWGLWVCEENWGIELDGKIVGIIGYGNNGSVFVKKFCGFDVMVLVYDKYK